MGENYPEQSHWVINFSEKLEIQFLCLKEDHDKKEKRQGQKRKTAIQIRESLRCFVLDEQWKISQFQSSNHNSLKDDEMIL